MDSDFMEYVSFLIEKHPEERIYILPRSSAEEVARKLICHFSGVSHTQILARSFQTGDHKELSKAASWLKNIQLFIDPSPTMNFKDLPEKLKKTAPGRVLIEDAARIRTSGNLLPRLKRLGKRLNIQITIFQPAKQPPKEGEGQ